MIDAIFQDWEVNAGNPKGRLVLAFFRLCQIIRRWPEPWWYLGLPILVVYVVVIEWTLGIELGYRNQVGTRLRLYHGTGLVIHPLAVIGDDCILRHGVTLGYRRGPGETLPIIGHRVEFGCGSSVLGPITIGDDAKIAAGAVVLKDVPPGGVAVGNPARIIRSA